MAHYTGLVTVDTTSYNDFKSAVLGNSYDVDRNYGAQCVDLFMLLNGNLGYPPPYVSTGLQGYAFELWTVLSSRYWNAGNWNVNGWFYDLITDKTQIQKGDMIIMNATTDNPFGHNCLADEPYNGTDTIRALGQNQAGGTPVPTGGTTAVLTDVGLDAFLGAFRPKAWNNTPAKKKKHKFPWFIYQEQFRKQRNMI